MLSAVCYVLRAVQVISKGAERGIYSTAKAGVNHWTKMLASEMQPYGINVNAIKPGAP